MVRSARIEIDEQTLDTHKTIPQAKPTHKAREETIGSVNYRSEFPHQQTVSSDPSRIAQD
jgi:hypothetical protein